MAGPAEGRPQGALAQTHCSTNVQERQEEACYARGNSSPQLKLGDSLPRHVEKGDTGSEISRERL